MPSAPRHPAATMRGRAARAVWMDPSLPVAIRRRMRWKLLAGVFVCMAAAAIVLSDLPRDRPEGVFAMTAVLLVAAIAAGGLAHLFAAATVARAAAHDHLLCPECTYDRRTFDDAGTCPECGRAYEHEAVRAQWIEAERRLKRKEHGKTTA